MKKEVVNGCYYNEKTADEMFAKLGYEIAEKNKDDEYDNICFEKEDYVDVIYDKKFIIFWLEGINEVSCYGLENEKPITMQELQAINKKVQELGWIYEREEKENDI